MNSFINLLVKTKLKKYYKKYIINLEIYINFISIYINI